MTYLFSKNSTPALSQPVGGPKGKDRDKETNWSPSQAPSHSWPSLSLSLVPLRAKV